MIINKIYISSKSIIPRWLQIQLRKYYVHKQHELHADSWPIDRKSVKPPAEWTGWPDGKKFALVLTHDIESAKGLNNCHQLMEIEERLGFRSSFNFVLEDYPVPAALRQQITDRGFEVGVHGLHHHNNPFRSKLIFQKEAIQINRYLKEWGSVGFRSPSMYHNLELLHYLNIEYDASTFDTDPFEPQPDGVGTIFPFWVSGYNDHQGYVELPYTLPQDFLLYILLQQKNIDIWKEKLDWIAENGGMALFICHPNYISFNHNSHYEEYPAQYYEEFLTYIKTKYAGQYWNILPKEIARFWSANYRHKENLPKKRRHICMLAYSFYESDNRIMRYAEALAQRGDIVDVIALMTEGSMPYEKINNVNVYRIQKRMINEKNQLTYLTKLGIFLIKSFAFITKKHLQHPYDVVHIHSVPDFEVFAALIPKLQGSSIILDIHDIVPEFYASKFSGSKDSFFFKALVKVEQLSIKFSDHVIISNHLWYKTLTSRSVNESKCTTVMNYPDEAIFYQRPRTRLDDKFIMIYPGSLGWHQGLDIAIKAFAKIKDQAPQAEFHIYGRGPERDNLAALIAELHLDNKVFIKDPMPIDKIAEVMANADLGIVPKRNDPFGGEAFSTKILEFMSLNIPVIVSGTKIDKHYFNDSVVKLFNPDDVNDLAQSMLTLLKDKEQRDTLRDNALRFVENYRWSKKKNEYFDLVDSLIDQHKKS
jgi:glycosyltransferase involved in cell wall biosynthesis/peptidoglycan/xylan/chitin deacetylase (PgdA/CDA1 family)